MKKIPSEGHIGHVWPVLFLSGVLFALLAGDMYLTDSPLGSYRLSELAGRKADRMELFWTIFLARGRFFAMLCILCASAVRRFVRKVMPPCMILLLGVYCGVCIVCQGVWGIGLFAVSLIPHGPLYILAGGRILHMKKPMRYGTKQAVLAEIASVFVILVLFAAACALETTVGNALLLRYLGSLNLN